MATRTITGDTSTTRTTTTVTTSGQILRAEEKVVNLTYSHKMYTSDVTRMSFASSLKNG